MPKKEIVLDASLAEPIYGPGAVSVNKRLKPADKIARDVEQTK